MMDVRLFYACQISAKSKGKQCLYFNNLTPTDRFKLDRSLPSPKITLDTIKSDGSLRLIFSEAMNFDKLKKLKLSELKVYKDFTIVKAFQLSTGAKGSVWMNPIIKFES